MNFRRLDWPALASLAVLTAGIGIAYHSTFSVPLLFDDDSSIRSNPSIRKLWPLWPVLFPPATAMVAGRPLFNLSLALNYRFGGTAVAGYHWINLAIHLFTAGLIFGLVRRTLRLPGLAERWGAASTGLALAVSALWAWHPVLTESVTYISQRAESMMGLFYTLTLYSFVRGATAAGGRRGWWTLSFFACLAGMATKEVMVTAPLMVLLYDWTFLSGTPAGAWRSHRSVLVALAATWIPLGFLVNGLGQRNIGLGHGISAWAYGLTECRAIVRYVGLAVWPHPLVFDYGVNFGAGVGAAARWGYAAGLIVLLAATTAAFWRWRRAGFAAVWFFLLLAPTSSIIPVVGQPMAENRLYLPLAGAALLAVLGLFRWLGRASWAVLAALAIGLDWSAARRNRDYASAVGLWSDTLAKNPTNDRAEVELGLALAAEGRADEAMAHYRAAVRLNPNGAEAHNDLGDAEDKIPGGFDDAVREFETAIRLRPDFYAAHYNLGTLLETVPGREEEAIAQLEAALRLRPDFPEARRNLGIAHANRGNALFARGQMEEAAAELNTAAHLDPASEETHYNLGNVLRKIPGRQNDAIAQYELALRLKPDHAEAHNNLGNALAAAGRTAEAIGQYQEALRLKPDFVPARMNLNAALSRSRQSR